jgi:REP element-mobilizing transposase RayT
VLLYHFVCPVKYRRTVLRPERVDDKLKKTCIEISKRYEIRFLEIGTDKDHVHFLIQSVPMYGVKKIIQIVKSITARKIFQDCPEVKEQLWGGEFWSDGYFVNTVGQHGNENSIINYIKKQGIKDYRQLHTQQLILT